MWFVRINIETRGEEVSGLYRPSKGLLIYDASAADVHENAVVAKRP